MKIKLEKIINLLVSEGILGETYVFHKDDNYDVGNQIDRNQFHNLRMNSDYEVSIEIDGDCINFKFEDCMYAVQLGEHLNKLF